MKMHETKLNLWNVTFTELRKLIDICEKLGHSQQVAYSTNLGGMTQICYTCQSVNTSIQLKEKEGK